ncbi:hypothetical protein OIO90_000470 [Microbotryomycetes sp. JL221]|nr:hypothetical protein OIO90_000470 [Microbotryomycetes sp. JL221]
MGQQRHGVQSRLWLAVAVVIVIHVMCYRATAPLRASSIKSQQLPIDVHAQYDTQHVDRLFKRAAQADDSEPTEAWHRFDQDYDNPHIYSESVQDDNQDPSSDSIINWRKIWHDASPKHRPFWFALMVIWLVFLFAFVGITASDFFCPNLSTIASRLGLSESVAGVTFLAFSNGSPDVFSTFAALSHDSGSLAIGELIGAASFIVSVVSGTMCLIKPFRVAKHTFLRDVGFFTVAITLTLAILYDSHIRMWEALGMVGLYIAYVIFVAVGSWWVGRRERKAALLRAARDEYADEQAYHDERMSFARSLHLRDADFGFSADFDLRSGRTSGRSTPNRSPAAQHSPGFQSPLATPMSSTTHPHMHASLDEESFFAAAERGTPVTLSRQRSGSTTRPSHRRVKTRSSVRPSLLGAIEFRDVVNSLREDSTARTLAVFGGINDELHTHATFVGTESAISKTADGARPRASSHSGAIRLPDDDDQLDSPAQGRALPLATTIGPVDTRPAWAGHVSEGSDESRPGWGEEESTSGGISTSARVEGSDTPIVDLSEDVDNPWMATHSRDSSRATLQLDIPAFQTHAVTSRIRSRPASMHRSPSNQSSGHDGKTVRKVPSIMLTSANGEEALVQPETEVPMGSFDTYHRGYRIARAIFLALFPSLQDFREKSLVGKATAILCVPAILLLNLTLPVVDTDTDDCASLESREALEEEEAYKDYDTDSDDENDLHHPPLVLTSAEGLLVDTSDDLVKTPMSVEAPPHRHHQNHQHGQNSHSSAKELARHQREHVARALHERVMAHPETDENGFEIRSPWASSSPGASPAAGPKSDYNPIAEAFAKFNMSSSNGRNETGSSGDAHESDGPVDPLVKPVTAPHLEVQTPVLTRWLTAIQCALGPMFCVSALMVGSLQWWYPLAALAGGLVLGAFAFWVFEDHRHPGRIVLCFVGFFVAMVWILTIVTEVVAVLQTIGHIFGLSDAILGLTVFAVGNSLGDLVANATVARMGFPSMAIAACFGGPMLNILLGIGLSGSYMILKNDGQSLQVSMSRTLLVSGMGLLVILLATLIVVPCNGYWMDKRVGAGLIIAYTCLLTINVLVEVFAGSH